MFANSRVTILRLTAVVIVTIAIALPIIAGIRGHFALAANITNSGSFLKINASGRGVFFDGLTPNGYSANFNFGIDPVTGTKISSGSKDIELLATGGDRLFGELKISHLVLDTNGVLSFGGDVHFYGGTQSYNGQKAEGGFVATIFTRDFTDSRGALHMANTGSFDFSATDTTGADLSAPSYSSSPGQFNGCAVAHFEYLGGPTAQRTAVAIVIWLPIALAALLRRRTRKKSL